MTRENGKMRFSRFSLAGTLGQCLLSPPEEKEGKIPFKLYNLGGVIFNLLLAAATLALYFAFPKSPTLSVVLLGSTAIGLFSALTNGIPMRGIVNNDGSNAVSLGKDIHAMRSFAKQLSVNARMAQGERLRDIPTELFELGEGADTQNPINNTITVFKCNRLLDEHRFSEARELCQKLIADETVMPIYKNMLVCDLAFCEMLAGETERAKSRFTKAQNKFMAAMAKNPSIIRTRYAYALLCEKNTADVAKYRAEFERTAKNYPYSGDIESERELMEEAERAVNL
jgi:tetratricopeptide (TPR) repeat protein